MLTVLLSCILVKLKVAFWLRPDNDSVFYVELSVHVNLLCCVLERSKPIALVSWKMRLTDEELSLKSRNVKIRYVFRWFGTNQYKKCVYIEFDIPAAGL